MSYNDFTNNNCLNTSDVSGLLNGVGIFISKDMKIDPWFNIKIPVSDKQICTESMSDKSIAVITSYKGLKVTIDTRGELINVSLTNVTANQINLTKGSVVAYIIAPATIQHFDTPTSLVTPVLSSV